MVRLIFPRFPGFLTLTGYGLLIAFGLAALFGESLAPHSAHALLAASDLPPDSEFYFGTDHLGRDVFSRVLEGTRYTILLALGATLLSLVTGTIVGAIAGYFGGAVDLVVSRLIEVFLTIPRLFLVILLAAFLGSHTWVIVLVIGGTMWPINARLMRAQALTLRERAFVKAAELAGVSRWRILFRHIIPNGLSPVLAKASLQIAEAILLEAGLSFLGLGDPSRISWGKMMQEGQAGFPDAWWPEVFPGLALALLLIAIHLVGDSIRTGLAISDGEASLAVPLAGARK
ncbi:ABC transporter permease [Microvirga alba]|uniref:ABC transporter permease n=1 Tax=Microvirga alba TaxID=2791025 RepID=A0A931BXJ3_9HYPH|nr:ABC transporter permease [Microvirga alba]MBF9235675.1 ABC transporter permease [Microvirga alba]